MKGIKRILLITTFLLGIAMLVGCIKTDATPEVVTIEVISNNETINTFTKNKGEVLTADDFNHSKEGYELVGMYFDSDLTISFEPPFTVTRDLSVYLKWEINKYNVTWKDSDGTILKIDSNINYNTMAQYDGTTPTKEGYSFTGWTPVLSKVTKDTTYTATYQKNDEIQSFMVKFYDSDKSLIKEESVIKGVAVVFETPIKSGYTFKGWLSNGKLVTTIVIVSSDLEFTASWELIVDGAIAKLDGVYNNLSSLINDPNNITEDFNVLTKSNGVTLAWSANGTNVVTFQTINENSSKVVVNRPIAGNNDQTITLTAVLTIKSELDTTKTLTKTWTIEITIKALEGQELVVENIGDILEITDEEYHDKFKVTIQNATVFAKGIDRTFIFDGSATIMLLNANTKVEVDNVYTISGTIYWDNGNWIIKCETALINDTATPQYPQKDVIASVTDTINGLEANGYHNYKQISDGNFEPLYARLTGKVFMIAGDTSNNNTFIIDAQASSLTNGSANKPASGLLVYYNTLNLEYLKKLVGTEVTVDVIIYTYQKDSNAFAIYYVGSPDVYDDYEVLFNGDWNRPGLYDKDGSIHQMPAEVIKTGKTINVNNYGAKANDDTFDNYDAFKNAIAAAKAGDEVFVPEGTYYFIKDGSKKTGPYYAHIALKDGIIFSGAGKDKTILVSGFSEADNKNKDTTVIAVVNSKNVLIKDLSISSKTDDNNLPDPDNSSINSGIYTAPTYGISIESYGDIKTKDDQTSNIVIRDVLVEKFQRMGIRIKNAREVTVKSSTFQKAVDLAGGGAGYGVCIQGSTNGVDWTDTTKDTYWNLVTENFFKGPYLRHGALIQYHAHNNAILNNKFEDALLDAIDMHGEDEYSNEIAYNEIINTRAGAAVGVGNSGAGHDAAGRNNYIHNNLIDGGRRGIDVILGTPQTVIKDNIIKNLTQDNSIGISISDAPTTYIIGNTFENIKSTKEGYGIKVTYYYNETDAQLGIPANLTIVNNSFNGVTRGVYVQTHDDNYVYENNTFTGSEEYDYLNHKDFFNIPILGQTINATESNYITRSTTDKFDSTKLKIRASSINGANNRMVYVKFDVSVKPVTYNRVYLSFTAKSEGITTLNFWASTSFTNWTTQSINWGNALLHHQELAKVVIDDPVKTKLIYNFTFPNDLNEYNTYYIDITDYILNDLDGSIFTLMISNDNIENKYIEIYNHLASNNQNLRLIFT